MTTISLAPRRPRLSSAFALGLALALMTVPSSARAQRRGAVVARRGAPGAVVPLTDADITVGGAHYAGRVDAECRLDARATATNTRFYYVVNYPWFGYRPPADQPQWRFGVSVRRGDGPAGASTQFVFSFADGARSGTIQNVSFAKQRYGSGTVRVTRHGTGARFEVNGRTDKGEPVRATIDCPELQNGEGVGG